MFGWGRKRITQQVIDAVRPSIGMIQSFQGLPAGFWRDEYALGYIYGQIAAFLAVLGQERMKPEHKGYVMIDTFTDPSNINGRALANMAT